MQWTAGRVPHGPLREAWFRYNYRFMQGMSADLPRAELHCAMTRLLMPTTLGHLWISKHYEPCFRQRVLAIAKNIQEAAATALRTTDWMSKGTREEAVKKLRAMEIFICWPPLSTWKTTAEPTNPTPQQLNWLKSNDISRDELDIRRGTEVAYGESDSSSDQFSDVISKVSELNIIEFSRQIDNVKDQLQSIIGDVTSSYDANYNRVNKAENPNNLPEDQIKKLTKIYLALYDAGTSLFNIEEILGS
jgi:hypothetical protein